MAYSAWKPTIVDRYTHWVDSADVEHTIFRAAKAGGPPERLKTNAYTYARSFAIAGAWINFNDGPRLYKVAR